MRVLRRVAGESRYGQRKVPTDDQVRRDLGMPSLLALIIRRRLMLLSSVLRSGCKACSALLSLHVESGTHHRMPWVELVLGDQRLLQQTSATKLDDLRDPHENAEKWETFILDYPGPWRELVKTIAPFSLGADADLLACEGGGALGIGSERWVCDQCEGKTFYSFKELLALSRARHGHRNDMRRYVAANARCPVCCTVFANRPKTVAHLNEKRRPGTSSITCGELIAAGLYEPLSDIEVAKVDESDKALRARARKMGHTQPRATFFAGRTAMRVVPGLQQAQHGDYLPRKRLHSKAALDTVEWRRKSRRTIECNFNVVHLFLNSVRFAYSHQPIGNRRQNVCKNILKNIRKSSQIMENPSKIVPKSMKNQ